MLFRKLRNPIKTSLLAAAMAACLSASAGEDLDIVLPEDQVDGLAQAWDRLSRIDFQGAYDLFRELRESGEATEREANLGIAVTMLNLPPKTQGKIDQAEAMLAGVWEADSEDQTGLMAWIYHARIPHLHRREPRYEEAYRRYDALAVAHPDHFLGQYARLKTAMLDLLANDDATPETVDARVAYWREKASNVTHPILLRNLSRLLGEQLIFEGGSLKEAQAYAISSVENEPSRFDIMRYWRMRSINLAMLNEDYPAARELLIDYLNAFPGTWKTYAEGLLAEVEAKLSER